MYQQPCHTQKTNENGFNLIEAAIVLAVVGLVVGGIWAAASAIRFNMQINDSVRIMGTAVNKIRMMPLQQINQIIDNQNYYSPTNMALEKYGMFPTDAYSCNQLHYGERVPCTVWGSPIDMTMQNWFGTLLVAIRYPYMSKAACIQLARKVATSIQGVYQIRDPYANIYISYTGGNCADGLNIYWTFKIVP